MGQTLGEKLADGFQKTVGDITSWFDGLTDKIQEYQAEMAKAATAAADSFWAGREDGSGGPKTEKPPEVIQNITLNINQPVKTPVELTRDLKRTFEEVARLL